MIYATPFDPETLECTAPSAPAGFATMNQVLAALGPPPRRGSYRSMLIYGTVIFTRFPWRVDAPSNAGYREQTTNFREQKQ